MMHLLTLIFGLVLLPKAYTLKCYECLPDLTGTCTDTEKQCPASSYQCAVARVVTYLGGSKLSDINAKSCALPEECLSGSVNFGFTKSVLNSSCCTTDLCNSHRPQAPVISNMMPNGKKCFTCNVQTKQCKATLNCEGTEDHCITASGTVGGEAITVKGCASRQACSSSQSISMIGSIRPEISCCQGDYCNNGSSARAGLLLLVAPLIYFIVFS